MDNLSDTHHRLRIAFRSAVQNRRNGQFLVTGLSWQEDNPDELESSIATIKGKFIVGTGDTEGSMRDFMQLQLVK